MKTIFKKNKRNHVFIFIILSMFLIFCLTTSQLKAENEASLLPTKKESEIQQDKTNQSKISKDEVKLFLKQVDIFGRIAKPQTVFIIPGSDPKVDGLKINRRFYDLIFRKVEKSSLKRVQKRKTENKVHIQW